MQTVRFVPLSALAVALALRAFAQITPAPDAATRTYLLGPDDVISIRALDAEEISDKAVRIGTSGFINLPMVGRVQAGGVSVEQLEADLAGRLKRFVRNPEVSVNVVELRSQPVSVIGSVKNPGVHQLQGHKTLVEILSLAGGITDDAGYSVRITRHKEFGSIPLPSAAPDATGQYFVAEVGLRGIMEAKNPVENVEVMPNDVISVPRAQMVYVIGEVMRSGGFALGERQRVSVLQALSLAGGLGRMAKRSDAKILRTTTADDAQRTELAVNLDQILRGKDKDVPLLPNDILFIPNSKARSAMIRTLEAMFQVGTNVAVYRVGQ
jgi:polysaccharide export outer membrane protein